MLLFLSLITFSQSDPSLNHAVSGHGDIRNGAGIFGAYTAGLLVDLLGISSYFLSVGIFGLALTRSLPNFEVAWWRWLGVLILALCIAGAASFGNFSIGEIKGGGICGTIISRSAVNMFGVPGAVLTWLFILLASIYLVTSISWITVIKFCLPKPSPKPQKEAAEPEKNKKYNSGSLRLEPNSGANSNKPHSGSGLLGQGLKLPLPNINILGTIKSLFQRNKDSQQNKSLDSFSDKSNTGNISFNASLASNELGNISAKSGELQAGNSKIKSSKQSAESAKQLEQVEQAKPDKPDKPDKLGKLVEQAEDSSLPSINLLTPIPTVSAPQDLKTKDALQAKGRDLMACLADFSIQGKLLRVVPGPVVTMFEIRPAPGVKVSRIAGLADDIALAMKALAVRVQAPIPGTDAVGIEIPNEHREMVSFREIMASPAFSDADSLLTMALGKDIAGEPAVADLAKMPHLLVAGATGAGKSVCLNSIILSLIFKANPDQLKMLLIDPKRIELAVYADLPHLVHPVVTEMTQAKSALDWAVHEMDRRYSAIAQLGVRGIKDYNSKLAELKLEQPETVLELEPMPYLVIIIDELADLMLTAGKEVEVAIVRLAQLARAAGIHLILATQRPSVDVVTGLIKANFPCRIAFQVTSKHDSRTILDTVGAEHLLGKGDLLIKPGGGRMKRLHGAFVPDEDVVKTVAFWKKRVPAKFDIDFNEWGQEDANSAFGSFGPGSGTGVNSDTANDPLYGQAVEFVMEQGKASISLIQRRFRIGFNKAARFVEQMEQDGIIGPADGSRPRQVIK